MESRFTRTLRIALWVLGWAFGIYGIFVGNEILINVGLMIAGGTLLYFHREYSDEFIKLNPTTSKAFIRYSTPVVGGAFFLFGLVGLLTSIL